MAIVIKQNELRNYIKDIEIVDERLMTLTLSGQIDVTIVAAYAPTAIATAEDKDKFDNTLCTITTKYKKERTDAYRCRSQRETGDGAEGVGPNILTSHIYSEKEKE